MSYRPLRNSIELSGDAARVYRIIPPADLLPYVLEFWEYKINPLASAVPTQIFPNGCVSIRFNVRKEGVESILYGPSTNRNMKGWLFSEWIVVGAVIRPERAYHLLGLSAHEFRDLRIKFDCIWPNRMARIEERMSETKSFRERADVMIRFLRASIRQDVAPKNSFLSAYREIVDESGVTTNITDIAKRHGVNDRNLRRQFRKYLGLSPKEMARVARLQQGLKNLSRLPGSNISKLSLDAGYCEQSHFTREFQDLTGMAPGKFASLVGKFSNPELDIWRGLSAAKLFRDVLSPDLFRFN